MSAITPRTVTPFEDKLLRIARAVLGVTPLDQALTHIAESTQRPAALSRAAVDLVRECLGNGCVLALARSGGWRRERFLRDGKPRDGRLWERTAPAKMALQFSRQSLELLLWLTTSRPDEEKGAFSAVDSNLTAADRLLVLLVYDALRDSEFGPAMRLRPAFATNGLARLAFADDWAGAGADLSFEPWCEGLGAVIVEALAPWLAERVLAMEQRKSQVGDWQLLAAIGREQDRTLLAFTSAAESAGRLDLVRFLLDVATALLPDGASVERYYGGLQGAGPMRLAERTDVFRRAVALPRHVLHLRDLERRARSVGYLDEGYTAAQSWLGDWERLGGETLAERARELVDRIEPIKVGA